MRLLEKVPIMAGDISLIDIMEKDTLNLEMRDMEEDQRKEEWNRRLLEYKQKIDSDILVKEDIPELIDDIFYKYQGDSNNTIRTELKKRLGAIKSIIAEYYHCNENEICIGSTVFDESKPYVIILGDVSFEFSFEQRNLGNLRIIAGNADFRDCSFEGVDIGSLEYIGGKINWGEFKASRDEYEEHRKEVKDKSKSPLQEREEKLSMLEAEAEKYSKLEKLQYRLEASKGQGIGE